jgi:multiple sugar transport system permease protein
MTRRAWIYGLPAVLLLAVFVLLPFTSVVRYATWDWSGFGDPRPVGLGNFERLLRDGAFWRSLRTTVVFAAVTLPLFLLLSRTIAIAIEGTRLERATKVLLLVPAVTTVAGAAISWYLLYNPNYGLVVEATGLSVPWETTPWAAMTIVVAFTLWQNTGYGVLVISAALRGIPGEVKEAARVDGANDRQLRRFVIYPLLRRATTFLVVIGSVLVLQSYTAVYLLTRGGPYGSTRVAGYFLYETAFERLRLGYGAAATLLVLALVIAVAALEWWWTSGDEP